MPVFVPISLGSTANLHEIVGQEAVTGWVPVTPVVLYVIAWILRRAILLEASVMSGVM